MSKHMQTSKKASKADLAAQSDEIKQSLSASFPSLANLSSTESLQFFNLENIHIFSSQKDSHK